MLFYSTRSGSRFSNWFFFTRRMPSSCFLSAARSSYQVFRPVAAVNASFQESHWAASTFVLLCLCLIFFFVESHRRLFLERLGEAFLLAVLDEYSGALQSLGSDLFSFLQNLGSVYQEMKTTSLSGAAAVDEVQNRVTENPHDISFSCVPEQGRLTLHFRTANAACGYLWAGVLKVRFP